MNGAAQLILHLPAILGSKVRSAWALRHLPAARCQARKRLLLIETSRLAGNA
jgi:hypothetical protein